MTFASSSVPEDLDFVIIMEGPEIWKTHPFQGLQEDVPLLQLLNADDYFVPCALCDILKGGADDGGRLILGLQTSTSTPAT